jgi:hypothetical protein
MALNRQPTIKTLLLLTAVVALLCAAMPRGRVYLSGWIAFGTELVFWIVVPLLCGTLPRTTKRTCALSLAVGAVYATGIAVSFEFLDVGIFNPDDIGGWWDAVLVGLYGPVICLATPWDLLQQEWYAARPIPNAVVWLSLVGWLVAFVVVSTLTAMSCRPREQAP